PPLPALPPAGGVDHDDLALQSGRKHLKAHQRGVDGAALSQLVMTLPIALISLSLVSFAFALLNPVLGLIMPVAWLLSGPLVFHRPVEAAIAGRLLGLRRPTPEEAQRLAVVWEQVTRRAGVNQHTYELWVQESTALNATAVAGHIVGVTRHAMERLPNSQLAAVLAHELGHHVGGHTWAAMLADWYALPARTVGRWILAGITGLLGSKNVAGVACGGCLVLVIAQFLYILTFQESMWWLILPLIAAPLLIAWLHRRAECRADDYAAGLGFATELMSVLAAEHQSQSAPGVPPPGTAPHTGQPAARGAHTNFEARLRHLQRDAPGHR
ncbi:M48 family metalloprotease, partial [Streptomyces sp. UNOB3_S3]|uniref:M48 family metalloprotease n=1 Tax=Streptomyces sp. UNOB3_S3 TaxID=2871682 RepID=UPI001E56540F